VVGDSMTPELILQVGAAFAKYVKRGTVVVGRDSRPTGSVIASQMESILAMSGCDVVDIGVVPTPTVQLMVEELNAAGGIVISASHNPIEWNAFKLINSNGTFLNSREIEKFFKYMEEDFKYMKWDRIGNISTDDSSHGIHIKHVLKVINKNRIKKNKYKIVLDSVNGAGSIITPSLLSNLGCKTVPLYCDITGQFPRGAEPIPQNLGDLSQAVIKNRADIGFAQDPDADRLAIVDEKGRPIGEENTIALVTEHLLSHETGRVVINLSTTKAVEDIAVKYGVKAKRAKVGEINVVDEMRKNGARIGGEGNGGVISPEVHLGRDSLVAIGYILDMMAERKKSLSELVEELPSYVMKKGKVKINRESLDDSILLDIKNKYSNEKVSMLDGLRIDFVKDERFRGGWVHLRSSNTEPIFRVIAEGMDEKQTSLIYKHFEAFFK